MEVIDIREASVDLKCASGRPCSRDFLGFYPTFYSHRSRYRKCPRTAIVISVSQKEQIFHGSLLRRPVNNTVFVIKLRSGECSYSTAKISHLFNTRYDFMLLDPNNIGTLA